MEADKNKINIDKITDGVISYLEFLNKFNTIKQSDILCEINDNKDIKYKYLFSDYNIECYIIDRNSFDNFCSAINFNELKSILNTINEENKNKFKEELNKYLKENPFNFNNSKIKFYSNEKEMKEIINNIDNYSYVNKELLINGMGLNETELEGHLIKSSRNENNLSLLFTNNNYIITINEENKKNLKNENNEYKFLYYVEDVTKKIFLLLYFHEKKMKEKIKKKIKNIYNFKKYYLINKDWLKDYKEYFLYDFIIKKLDEKYQNYSYEKIKVELDNISKNEIGQIILYLDTKIPKDLRKNSYFKCKTNEIKMLEINGGNTNNDYIQETIEPEESNTSIEIPDEFELINEDIYELLSKEEFFYNNIEEDKDKILYEILFGNNQIIIKNKNNENNENNFLNTYLIYIYNNEYQNKEKYFLKYILDYENNSMFFDNFGNIIEEGLNNFISKNDININNFNCEQKIYDIKKNVLGKFVNIGILSNDKILNIIDRKNSIINSNIILNKKNEEKYKKKNIVSKNERFLLKNILDIKKYYDEKNFIENNTSFSYEINNKKKEKFDSQKLNIINNEIEINLKSEYKNDINSINIKKDIPFKIEKFDLKLNCMQVESLTDEPEVNELKIERIEKFDYIPNNIETSSSIFNIDNNIDYSNNSLVNFDKLKIKMNIVEPYLKEIYKQFTINKEMKNLEINLLIPIEIINVFVIYFLN